MESFEEQTRRLEKIYSRTFSRVSNILGRIEQAAEQAIFLRLLKNGQMEGTRNPEE